MAPIDDTHTERGPRRQLTEAERRRIDDDDRRRMLQNVAAFVFIVGFLAFSAWLIDRLIAYNHNMSCIQSHHRNC